MAGLNADHQSFNINRQRDDPVVTSAPWRLNRLTNPFGTNKTLASDVAF